MYDAAGAVAAKPQIKTPPTATGVPLHGPTDVQWMGDHDGRQKWVGGIVQFERAQSEESITHYNASWFTEAVDLGVVRVCVWGGSEFVVLELDIPPPQNPFIEDITLYILQRDLMSRKAKWV